MSEEELLKDVELIELSELDSQEIEG